MHWLKHTIAAALALTATLAAARARADLLYEQNFNSATVESGLFDSGLAYPDGWFHYGGPTTISPDVGLHSYTYGVDANGVGGSNALFYQADGAATFGTNWYWYAGIGRSNMGGQPPNTTPNNVQFSLDLSIVGDTAAMPVTIRLFQYDPVSDSTVWASNWTPSLSAGFNHVTFKLNTGAYDPPPNPEPPGWTPPTVWNPALEIGLGAITFNSGGFGLDDGNVVHVDNVILETFPGDVNSDEIVDIFDVNVVSANWATAGPTGDANHDGVVDIFDVNLISANWTTAGAAAAVPEPSSLVLAGLGIVSVLALARRRGA